jgi:hypothetical protein
MLARDCLERIGDGLRAEPARVAYEGRRRLGNWPLRGQLTFAPGPVEEPVDIGVVGEMLEPAALQYAASTETDGEPGNLRRLDAARCCVDLNAGKRSNKDTTVAGRLSPCTMLRA